MNLSNVGKDGSLFDLRLLEYSELRPSLYQVEFFIFRQVEIVRAKTRQGCLKSKDQSLPALGGLAGGLG